MEHEMERAAKSDGVGAAILPEENATHTSGPSSGIRFQLHTKPYAVIGSASLPADLIHSSLAPKFSDIKASILRFLFLLSSSFFFFVRLPRLKFI